MTQEVLSPLLDVCGLPKILYGPDTRKSYSIVVNKFKNIHCLTKEFGCTCEQCSLVPHPNFYCLSPKEDSKSKAKVKSIHIKSEDLKEFVNLRTPLFDGTIFNVILGIDWCTYDSVSILLKTLEECKDNAQWWLIANDINNINGAIRSRCVEIYIDGSDDELLPHIQGIFNLNSWDALTLLDNLCKVRPPSVILSLLVRTHPTRVTDELHTIINLSVSVFTNLVKSVYLTMAK